MKPRKPLRLTRGNRSAVATPTSAVLAARRRSAARMSGRRRSSSPGSPIGRALVIAGRSRGERSTVNSSGRWPRRVAIRCLARSASACSCGTLAAVAARRASARSTSSSAPTPASRSCSVSWRDSFWFSRLLRAIFAQLRAAQLAVGVHQLGDQADLQLLQVGLGRFAEGVAGLQLTADAPEQIKLPGAIQAKVVALAVTRSSVTPGCWPLPMSALARLVTTGKRSLATSSRRARAARRRAKATRRSRLPLSDCSTNWFRVGSSNCFHHRLSKRLRS